LHQSRQFIFVAVPLPALTGSANWIHAVMAQLVAAIWRKVGQAINILPNTPCEMLMSDTQSARHQKKVVERLTRVRDM
jgi:hypothetical protein